MVPQDKPTAEAITIAKGDLRPGDRLDTYGGYTFYGLIDKAEDARRLDALPLGIAPGSLVVQPVEAGQVVTWQDVSIDGEQTVNKLRMMQDGRQDTP